MENEKIDRILILEKNIYGDLSRCNVCGINFTAIQPCIVCSLIIEKEQKLNRKLTKNELNKLIKGICG
jgi:hypothetical protein